VRVQHRAGGLEINVQDTGRGIPADRIDKIFEKFEQAAQKDRKTGSGLGLWICRRVMELHGGRITVQSIEGEGSCFTLWFPAEKIL
jgi:signal transduction histidine kinase